MPTLEEGGRRGGSAVAEARRVNGRLGLVAWRHRRGCAESRCRARGGIHSRVLGSRVGGVAVSGVDDAHIGKGRAGGLAGEGDSTLGSLGVR